MPFRKRPSFETFLSVATQPPDWATLSGLAPELAALEGCRQDPDHHGEGDVAAHTHLVLQAMRDGRMWRGSAPEIRSVLYWTAALHDIGKPKTTRRDDDGRWRAPGHAAAGARMARRLFWEAGAPAPWREAVCGLIAAHMRPFHLIDQPDPRRAAIDIAESLQGSARANLLLAQCRADVEGRICPDGDELADKVALAEALFEEHGLISGGWRFANGPSRAEFFARQGRDPFYAHVAPAKARVTMMSGLPGAGKDRWIAAHGDGRPVVSLDAIRKTIGAKPTGDQGRVIQAAYAEAREHLRKGRDFIWNATNLTRTLRAKPLALFRDYGAEAEIIYIEVSPQTLRTQNASREAVAPDAALDRMAGKIEPPDGREAASVRWIVNGEEILVAGGEADLQS